MAQFKCDCGFVVEVEKTPDEVSSPRAYLKTQIQESSADTLLNSSDPCDDCQDTLEKKWRNNTHKVKRSRKQIELDPRADAHQTARR